MKTAAARPTLETVKSRPVKDLSVMDGIQQDASFRNVLAGKTGAVVHPTTRTRIPTSKSSHSFLSFLGYVRRAVSMLGVKRSARKKLRLIETVSLGEKRFVALIRVEGESFLIGGSSTGVSLLSRLGKSRGTAGQGKLREGTGESSE